MFEGKSFFEILSMGGWTLYLLFIISILSVAVIILKVVEFKKKSEVNIDDLLKRAETSLRKDNLEQLVSYCRKENKPVTNVMAAGIKKYIMTKDSDIEEAMKREISIEVVRLEKFTTLIATIGSVAVYIGLFGTVLGIIRSFHDISSAGSGGISVVIGGVSESLIATAAGLCVAIPAVAAYNFLTRAIDKFVVDMEYTVSALKEIVHSTVNIK
ncbi:MAG: MotA/TolQ/ExbB proton channel family protein [Elusimicrobia bacterium]|nr:MotA/TolQ/ExbB proton channel family protein [Elusimicrobiota bacterium]